MWHQPGNSVLSGKYVGKQAVFGLFEQFGKISDGTFRIDSVTDIMENGPWVTATLHFSARSKRGAISMAGVDVMKVEKGKITEVYLFSSDQDAEDAFYGTAK